MANKTYVELVNSTIQESGAESASFSATGSDFNTNTDSLMRRFKVWVQRAWKFIQQDADDWHFLTGQAVVNIGPRIQFYIYGEIPGAVPATIDIYDSNDEVKAENVPVTAVVDLTGRYSGEAPNMNYGYITIDPAAYPLNLSLKPGNDYFYLEDRVDEISVGPGLYTFYDTNTVVGQTLSFVLRDALDVDTYYPAAGILTELTPATGGILIGTQGFKFITTEPAVASLISTGTYGIYIYNHPLENWDSQDPFPAGSAASFTQTEGASVVSSSSKAHIHSWGSFDWNEELFPDDYAEYVKKVNTSSYKILRTSYPEAGYAEVLPCVPWQSYLDQMDSAQTATSDPAFITEDSQGRWRLWPHPKERVTLTFDYARTPQILEAFDDVPLNLPEEYEDIIMWKALILYGEYDEQQSVIKRATKNYMDLKYRFEKNKRPVFNFKPANLRGKS